MTLADAYNDEIAKNEKLQKEIERLQGEVEYLREVNKRLWEELHPNHGLADILS